MSTIPRNRIPNVDLIDQILREFGARTGLAVGSTNRDDFPEWTLENGDTKKKVMIWPNIYMGSIGLFITPADLDRPLQDDLPGGGAMYTEDSQYTRRGLEDRLRSACASLGWRVK